MKPPLSIASLLPLCLLLGEVQAQPLPDPTRPPSPAEVRAFFDTHDRDHEPASGLRLQSVLISDQRRLAIINDQRVGEGDRIGQAEVLRIEPGRVHLRHHGMVRTLTLSGRQQHSQPSKIEQRND